MYGDKIRTQRKALKLSQKELAEQCGLSLSYIQQIESGKKNNPSLEALTAIADVLKVNIYSLLDSDMEEYRDQIQLNRCLDWIKPLLNPPAFSGEEYDILHGYTLSILQSLQYAYQDEDIREEYYADVMYFLRYLAYRYGFDPDTGEAVVNPLHENRP